MIAFPFSFVTQRLASLLHKSYLHCTACRASPKLSPWPHWTSRRRRHPRSCRTQWLQLRSVAVPRNEADERAQEAQERALEFERDLCLLEQELIKYKQQNESVSLCFHLSCFIGLFQLSGLIEIITGVFFNYLRQSLIYMIYETTGLRLIQLGSVEGFD